MKSQQHCEASIIPVLEDKKIETQIHEFAQSHTTYEVREREAAIYTNAV